MDFQSAFENQEYSACQQKANISIFCLFASDSLLDTMDYNGYENDIVNPQYNFNKSKS